MDGISTQKYPKTSVEIFVLANREVARRMRAGLGENHSQNNNRLCFYDCRDRHRDKYYILDNGHEYSKSVVDSDGIADVITSLIKQTQPKEVIFARPLSYDTITEVLLHVEPNGINYKILPQLYEKYVGKLKTEVRDKNISAVSLKEPNISKRYKLAKRLLDIILSILVLVIFSPIFIIVGLLIKLTSKGPIFHSQVRAGKDGHPFKLYKFRSMINNAEAELIKQVDINNLKEPVFKLKSDRRVTPIGRILRKTSIDELPQVINVLQGNMSWVGPRPEQIGVVRKYNAYYKERLRTHPGITGLQQVNARGIPSMGLRMKYDLAYIKNQSVRLDLKILLQSIGVVLSQKGAW